MSDHEELANEAERDADRFQRESDRVGEHIEDAKQALQATHDDAVIPTPLDEEDEANVLEE